MADKKSVTLSDVAQHVGLSKATVSLVMNGKAANVGLAKKTIDKIEAASMWTRLSCQA
ncbi:MAG: LacI family DNA-binding transcriptional regulator [Verrucomicrobiota bacterium]